MQIKEVAPGTRVLTSGPFTQPEIREVHYIRLAGQATRERHVRVARVRTIQGEPGRNPRYDSGEYHCEDPGEIPESIVVQDFASSIFLDAAMNLIAPIEPKPIATNSLVKPLEWSEYHPNNFTASTVHGHWLISETGTEDDDNEEGFYTLTGPDYGNEDTLYETVDAAKAVAEAKNLQNILKFLNVDPA